MMVNGLGNNIRRSYVRTGYPLCPLDTSVNSGTAGKWQMNRIRNYSSTALGVMYEHPEKTRDGDEEQCEVDHRYLPPSPTSFSAISYGWTKISTLREHLYNAYILICMTISMDQRLSAPTTRVVGPIAVHLAMVGETFSGPHDARGSLNGLTNYCW